MVFGGEKGLSEKGRSPFSFYKSSIYITFIIYRGNSKTILTYWIIAFYANIKITLFPYFYHTFSRDYHTFSVLLSHFFQRISPVALKSLFKASVFPCVRPFLGCFILVSKQARTASVSLFPAYLLLLYYHTFSVILYLIVL